MKNEELGISGRLRRSLTLAPKPILDHLTKRQRGVRQEISTLQSAIEIQALSPLVKISQIAGRTEATMTYFSSNDLGEIKATFIADKIDNLIALKDSMERSGMAEVVTELDRDKMMLTISAGK